MKKQFLTTCAIAAISLLVTNDSYGQWNPVGNVAQAQPVIDEIQFSGGPGAGSPNIRSIRGNTENYFEIFSHHDQNEGPSLFMYSHAPSNPAFGPKAGGISLWSSAVQGFSQNSDMAFELLNHPILHGGGSAGNPTSLLFVNKIGQVGIGTQSFLPENLLTLNGGLGFEFSTSAIRSIRGETENYLEIFSHHDQNEGPAFFMYSHATSDPGFLQKRGGLSLWSTSVQTYSQNSDMAFEILNHPIQHTGGSVGSPTTLMEISKDGQVVIGDVNTVPYTNNAPTYKLYVQTGILTEKVKVALSNDPYGNWSDFVFDDDYELRSLNEVESYIKENKHLPEIPSAEEVCREGLDLAKMDAKLLQKIEELTLYIIQQQKEIDELKNQLIK